MHAKALRLCRPLLGSIVLSMTVLGCPTLALAALVRSPLAQEVRLEYDHFVDFLFTQAPLRKQAQVKIDTQIAHLYGPMSHYQYYGTLRSDYQTHVEKIVSLGGSYYRAFYHFSGKALLHRQAPRPYPLVLPRDVDLVYKAGVVDKNGAPTAPCTHTIHSEAQYFWYYWWPYAEGCPLRENVDFHIVPAQVTPLPEAPATFPDYPRLVTQQKTLPIYLIVGVNESESDYNPETSLDINAPTYLMARNHFRQLGMKEKTWTQDEIDSWMPPVSWEPRRPFRQIFELETQHGTVQIHTFFGSATTPFSYFRRIYREALQEGSIMVFAGHSGLGSYLDLEIIESSDSIPFNLPLSQYQIFEFNNCSSYVHYTDPFFVRKRSLLTPQGTENLDILSNGLPTLFDNMPRSSLGIIFATLQWATRNEWISYDDILQSVDSGNLMNVSGSEDNPPLFPTSP